VAGSCVYGDEPSGSGATELDCAVYKLKLRAGSLRLAGVGVPLYQLCEFRHQ
jgi:hypothetical protein